MALSVNVLGLNPLPAVRALLTVPAGVSWSLHGSTADSEWLVADGVGTGNEAAVTDPWAPLGVDVDYSLTYGTTTEHDGPVQRLYDGQSAITDLGGQTVADFLWLKDGGDPRELQPRGSFFDLPGSYLPSGWFSPTAGAGGGSLVARTVMPHTRTLEDLVRANRPLILHHHEAKCPMRDRGCAIRPVRMIAVTGAPWDVTGRTDVMQHEWRISYRIWG